MIFFLYKITGTEKSVYWKKKFSSFFRYRVCTSSIWYFLFFLFLSPKLSCTHLHTHNFLSSLLPMYKFVEEIENHGKYVNEFFLYRFKEDWGWKYSFVCIYTCGKSVSFCIFFWYTVSFYIYIFYML